MSAFLGMGRVRKLFLNLDVQIENFHFLGIALFSFLTLTQLRIFFALLGCISTILDWGRVKKLFLGSPHIGYQLSFSQHYLILHF